MRDYDKDDNELCRKCGGIITLLEDYKYGCCKKCAAKK